MENNDIGYYEDPINSTNLKRARTTRSIRSWEFSRSLDSLEALNTEMGKIDYPGLYILFEGNDKVYIGEAKSLIKRLETHTKSPEEKIKNWEKVIIINDGRPATQSDFNDGVVRMALELYLIDLFKTNRYKVVAQGEPQSLNSIQKYMVESLKKELFFFLAKKGIINKQIEHSDEREVFSDEVKKILIKNGKKIEKWKEKESIIDGEKYFIRQGSKKSKGYQITIRGRKPGSFIDSLKNRKGYLLVRRNGLLIIPLKEIFKLISDSSVFDQDTIDIYFVFREDEVLLKYKDKSIDVTNFKIVK